VGADKVRFGRHDFRWAFFRKDILGRPENRLADGHVEKILPRLGLELLEFLFVGFLIRCLFGNLGDGLVGMDKDGPIAFLVHFNHHQVVPETGGNRFYFSIWGPVVQFAPLGQPFGHVIESGGRGRRGLEQEEPCSHRTIAVLESPRNEDDFLGGHLGAGRGGQIGTRSGVPGRIPGSPEAFTGGPRLENVNGAAGADNTRLEFEHIDLRVPHTETNGPRHLGFIVFIEQQTCDEYPFDEVVYADRILAGFGHDGLV